MLTVGVAMLLALVGITLAVARDGQDSPRGANPKCNGLVADIVGTNGDDQGADQISGTPGDDVIVSQDGADVIAGGQGDDTICAKPGDDRASGGAGDDHVRGGRGNDTIFGGAGKDELRGGKGDDEIFGEEGRDDIRGGQDTDECDGGPGRDRIQTCEDPIDPPDNQPPDAVDDENVTNEDAQITTHPLANDTDPDGDGLSVDDLDTSGTDGSVTIAGDGVQYDPDGQFESLADGDNATDTFGYTAGDGRGGSDDAIVTVTIAGVDDGPTAADDSKTVAQDAAPEQVNVLANDTDIDGGPKSVVTTTQPDNGTAAITGGGSGVTYEPDPGYCNDPGAEPTDDFDYTLNGGSSATVAVTVTCDVPPVAVDDSATVDEDALPQQINVLANDTNPDGGQLAVESVTQPANGSVQFTGSGDDLTYQPDPDYCNDPGAAPDDTFTYTLNGGDEGEVSVTVTCFDDTPVATDDEATVAEDSGATPIDVLLNDTDPDGNFQIQSVTQPANGTVVVAGDGQDLTYEPDPNYCNDNGVDPPDDFTYTLSPGASGASVSMIVTCVQEPPSVDLNGGGGGADTNASFTEDGAPAVLAPSTELSDVDDTQLESAEIELTNPLDGAAESISVDTTGTAIAVDGSSTLTNVVLTGSAPLADYRQVLRTADYDNTDQDPDTTARTVDFTVNDGGLDSNTAKATVSITPDNDAPVLDLNGAGGGIDTSASFTEDAGPAVLASSADVSDADNAQLASAELTLTNPQNGASETIAVDTTGTPITLDGASTNHHLILNGPATKAQFQQVIRTVTFENTSDTPNTTDRDVTVKVSDGALDSVLAHVTVSIAAANDAPTVDLNGASPGTGTSVAHTEDGAATDLAASADVTDPDDSNLEGADIEVTNAEAGDTLAVDVTGTPIAVDGASTDTHVILTGTATIAEYQQVLRTADYETASENPNTSQDRTVDFTANDGDADSAAATASVSITPNNDAPTVDLNGVGAGSGESASFSEDAGPADLAPDAEVADIDDTNLESADIELTNPQDGAAESISVDTTGTPITLDGASTAQHLILTGAATKAQYQQVLRTAEYDNTSNTPDTTARTIDFEVNDGDADSNTATSTVSVAVANDPPTVDLNGAGGGTDASATFAENGPASDLAPNTNVTDPDDVNLESADIELTNPQDGAAETITVDLTGTSIALDGASTAQHLILTGQDTKANYQQVLRTADYENTSDTPDTTARTVTFSANDGDADSNAPISTVTLTVANDPPGVDLNGAAGGIDNTAVFNEPGPAVDLAPSADVTDPEDANLEGADVELTNPQDGAAETIAVDVTGTPITVDGASTNHHLVLTGTATKAQYQQVLRSATYDNTATPPDATDRTVEFTVNDGDVDSAVATTTVDVVPLNEAPVVDLNGVGAGVDTTASFTEDGADANLAPAADVTDNDDANLESADIELQNPLDGAAETIAVDVTGTSVTVAGASTNHHIVLTGTATKAEYQQVLRTASYENTSDTPATTDREVEFTVNDGQADSAVATSTVTVTAANDAPTLDLNGASAGVDETASFTEDGGAVDLAPSAVAADVDDTNLESADITLTNPQDGALESIAIDVTGTPITLDGASTGHHLILTGTATEAQYQQVLRTAEYNNTDQDPNTTSRVVNFKVNDGDTDSGSPTTTVTVTAVNDAPVVDMNGGGAGIDSNAAFTEDSSPANPGSGAVALGPSATATDIDNANLASATITLTNHPDGASESLGVTIPGGNPITVTGNNSHALTLNGPATKAQFEAAIREVKYNNTSNTPDTANRDVTTVVNDGSDNSAAAHTTVTVAATNDAPVADNESFAGADSAVGNTTLVVNDPTDGAPTQADPKKSITGDILDGDSDPDGPAASLTVGPTGNQAITTQDGGKVTLEADGDFTFFPKAGTSCAENDQFDYTLSDNDGTDPETDTGTVSLTLTQCVWYANNSLGSNGTGTSTSPFNTLAASGGAGLAGAGGAGDSDDADDYLFLFQGSGTYTGGLPLENNQRLFSQRHGLTVGSTLFPASGNNATIANAGGNAVTLANSNTIQGIDLGATPAGNASLFGNGPTGTATVNTATSGSINNTAGSAVDVSTTAVDMAFADLDSSGATGDGIRLDNTSGTFTAGAGSSIQNAGGQDVDISGNNASDTVDFTYDGTISDASGTVVNVSGQSGGTKDFNGAIGTAATPAGAISLSSNTGATMRFDGGTIVSSGTTGAFSATGGGTVVVTDPNAVGTAPDNTLTTTSAIALNVVNTTIGADDLNFRSISSNGASSGIVLSATGSAGGLNLTGNGGTCTSVGSCTGGAIQNAVGDAVKLTSTNDVVLTDMAITSSDGSWIDATTVDGINLTRIHADSSTDDGFLGNSVRDLVIQGGTYFRGGADGEPTCNIDGFFITNLLGTSSITGTTFQRANTRQFFVVNNAATSFGGAPDTLTVSGTTWNNHAGPCGGDHLSVSADTGANFRVVTNASAGINTVNTGGIGVQATATGTNGKMDASVTGLKTSGNTAGAAFAATTNGSITYDVFDNNTDPPGTVNDTGFSGTGSLALAEVCTTTASCVGTWDNNTITATAGPGVDAVQAVLEGNGTNTIAITNNDITGNFQRGINLSSGGGTGAVGTLNATVFNNQINNSDPAGLQGVNVTAGLSGSPGNGETNKVCLNLFNNTSTSAGSVGYRFTNRASNVFQLQNFAGSGASDTDIVSWVNTTKGNTGTVAVQNDPVTFAPLSSAPGDCPTPP